MPRLSSWLLVFCITSVSVLCNGLAHAQGTDEELVIQMPKTGTLKAVPSAERDMQQFEGQVTLPGVLRAYWDKRTDEKNNFKSYKSLIFVFYPQASATSVLPKVNYSDEPSVAVNSIIINYDDKFNDKNKALAKGIFANIPNGFWKDQEGFLERPGKLTIDHYKTGMLCNSREFYAQLVKFEPTEATAFTPPQTRECSLNVVDYYSVFSRDNYANLREKPSIKASVITQLPNQTNLEKIRTEGDWFYVRTTDKPPYLTGYVHKSQVRLFD